MKIIDLSHAINNEITVFNEKERPEISVSSTHEKDGYVQKKITLFSHNSTHVDAPFHIIPDAPTLDQLPVETFYGPGLVADCRHCHSLIREEDLQPYFEGLINADFLLLLTGWDKKWNSREYKEDFPVLTVEAAQWLMQFKLKGIGLDTISIDEIQSLDLPVHKIVLGENMVIIENLTRLEEIKDKKFIFSCFPLPVEEADGSPVRAVGIVPVE